MAGRKPVPWEQRFANKLTADHSSPGCLIWTGAKVNGYGYFRGPDGLEMAHKVMWKRSNTRPHFGRMRNKCGHRACVNPEHWE